MILESSSLEAEIMCWKRSAQMESANEKKLGAATVL